MILDDRRKMRMIPAFRPWLAALLPAWPPRRRARMGRVGGRWSGRRGRLGLTPEELLLAEPEQGLEAARSRLELFLAIESTSVHGLPVAGEPVRLELLLQPRADRTGTRGRGGAEQIGAVDEGCAGGQAASRPSSETGTRRGVKQNTEAESSAIVG